MITAETTGTEIPETIGTANTKKVMIEKRGFPPQRKAPFTF
jgi:hypothetical protein